MKKIVCLTLVVVAALISSCVVVNIFKVESPKPNGVSGEYPQRIQMDTVKKEVGTAE